MIVCRTRCEDWIVNRFQILPSVGERCRAIIGSCEVPPRVKEAISKTHEKLVLKLGLNPSFAIRSSATAEDSPTSEFRWPA